MLQRTDRVFNGERWKWMRLVRQPLLIALHRNVVGIIAGIRFWRAVLFVINRVIRVGVIGTTDQIDKSPCWPYVSVGNICRLIWDSMKDYKKICLVFVNGHPVFVCSWDNHHLHLIRLSRLHRQSKKKIKYRKHFLTVKKCVITFCVLSWNATTNN